MNVIIKATQSFSQYLKDRYPEISIENTGTVTEDKYNAFFTMKPGDILISLLIAYSPQITDAIKDYVVSKKQNVIVTFDLEQYKITPRNVYEMMPIIKEEIEDNKHNK